MLDGRQGEAILAELHGPVAGRMSAGRAGAMTYLIPPTAIIISWLLLGETPPVVAILGGLLCIAGVVVARSSALRVSTPLRRRSTEAG